MESKISKNKILILMKIKIKDIVILVKVLTPRRFQENRGHTLEPLSLLFTLEFVAFALEFIMAIMTAKKTNYLSRSE